MPLVENASPLRSGTKSWLSAQKLTRSKCAGATEKQFQKAGWIKIKDDQNVVMKTTNPGC